MPRTLLVFLALSLGCAHRADGGTAGTTGAASASTPSAAIPVPPDLRRPSADARTTPSGLTTKVLRPGAGRAHPGPKSRVTVHYVGWTVDGTQIDSTFARSAPATFPLDAVIPGWTEGLQLMVVGEARRLWIPEHLAYKGKSGAPAGTLVFDVVLLGIE